MALKIKFCGSCCGSFFPLAMLRRLDKLITFYSELRVIHHLPRQVKRHFGKRVSLIGWDGVIINSEMLHALIRLPIVQNCIIRILLIPVEIGKDESFA